MSALDPLGPARAPSMPETATRVAPQVPVDGADAAADAPAEGLMARLGRWWERDRAPTAAEIAALFTARSTDVSANRLAARWCERYVASPPRDRREMLATLAQASAAFEPRGDHGSRLFKRLNAQPDGLRLLVQLREDMLRWRKQVAGLQTLDKELEGLLAHWFDVGMLELRPLTWDSPASLLEKLIIYEAVHEIRSWDDLKHRLAADRRCYAFFHPRMADVPLIFVEVAVDTLMSDNVQTLLDPQVPTADLTKVRWAIFYSISNTQPGLRGISFGNFLLKRVIDALVEEQPRLRHFATLSPIPGFADWLTRQDAAALQAILHEGSERATRRGAAPAGARWAARLRQAAQSAKPREVVQRAGMRLAAHYLTQVKNGAPLDPVARFHLGNGARLERLNWAADRSAKGLEQSCGLMVNYLYELDELDENLAALAKGGPRVSRSLGRLL